MLLDYHKIKITEYKGLSDKDFKDFIQYRILPNTIRISIDTEDIRGEKIKNWLRNTTEKIDLVNKVQDLKNEVNKYPHIFKTANDFNFFEAILESTVSKENPKVSDYAFIFHQLFNQKPNAIHHHVTHKTFIEFLNSEYNADIYESKLNKRKPKSKMVTYDSLFKKFYTDFK